MDRTEAETENDESGGSSTYRRRQSFRTTRIKKRERGRGSDSGGCLGALAEFLTDIADLFIQI